MGGTTSRGLASRNRLAVFHRARATLYRVAYDLLGEASASFQRMTAELDLAVANLDDAHAWTQLGMTLKQTKTPKLLSERDLLGLQVVARCSDPRHQTRRRLIEALKPPGAHRDVREELAVLSQVAGQIGYSLTVGDFSRAADLDFMQREFIVEHAGECLESFGSRLGRSEQVLWTQLGAGIQWLIGEDRQMSLHGSQHNKRQQEDLK